MHKKIFVLALIFAALSAVYSYTNLRLRTDRADLIDEKYEFHQRWVKYATNFNLTDDIVVVVKSAKEEDRVAAIEALAQVIDKDKTFKQLLYKIDKSSLSAKKLYFVPIEDLEKLQAHLKSLEHVTTIKDFYNLYPEHADAFNEGALEYIKTGKYVSPWEQLMPLNRNRDKEGVEYISIANLSFLHVKPAQNENQFDRTATSVAKIRQIVESIKKDHPTVKFGLTGLPVLESDEMTVAQESNNISTVISFVGTVLLFVLGFGKIRNPSIVVFSLCLSLCYSFAAITLLVGHLNILSMFFISMLIGIGIDYGIYMVSVYDGYISRGIRKDEAIKETLKIVTPSITAGALTTAAGFAATYFCPFLGLKELGITAAIGIIVCFISTLLVLPSMLALFADEKKINLKYDLVIYNWVMAHLRPIFLLLVVMIGGMSFIFTSVSYNRNLLHLQPDTEAVFLERYISEKTGLSAWYAVSLCDNVEEYEKKKAMFEKLPMVGKVETITSLLPQDQDAKHDVIKSINNLATSAIGREAELMKPEQVVSMLKQLPETRASRELIKNLEFSLFRRNPKLEDNYKAFFTYQGSVFKEMSLRAEGIAKASSAEKVQILDLPEVIQNRFLGEDGRIAMHIYCDGNLWVFNNLHEFVTELRKIDPELTGHPVGYYEATLQMETSYKSIFLWGGIGIIVILLFVMKDLWLTFLTIIPLIIGGIFTFASCKLLGIELNTANIIAFPIILGTGIDNSIHFVGEYRKGEKIIPSYAMARGAFFACTTTIVGFGALLPSSHKGLVGLGQIVCIGMIGCIIGTIMLSYMLNALVNRKE